jgi:hypothetical protein
MTDGTRQTIERLDYLLAPDAASVSMGRNIRNVIFGFSGRILFNLVTDPVGTYTELNSITYDEIKDRALSDSLQTLFTGRFWLETFARTFGLGFLSYLGSFSRSESREHTRRNDEQEKFQQWHTLSKYYSPFESSIYNFV